MGCRGRLAGPVRVSRPRARCLSWRARGAGVGAMLDALASLTMSGRSGYYGAGASRPCPSASYVSVIAPLSVSDAEAAHPRRSLPRCDRPVLRINPKQRPRRRRLEGGALFDCPSLRDLRVCVVDMASVDDLTARPSCLLRRSLCSVPLSGRFATRGRIWFLAGLTAAGAGWCRPPLRRRRRAGPGTRLYLAVLLSSRTSCGRAGCPAVDCAPPGCRAHHGCC